ncbi:LysR family transcriptional regulator [Sulfitobacter sp. F26204]|uniref:LysR family transcriptional regulator n=1 Tax=Sulfitobacter sp. F26204 TaxID=2996014 RepID=UPI002B2134DF|nr:LysR family transcriptional regulator [Sulfitobacter sp. F26204]
MNMDQTDWNHLRAFLATADHGSLSAAARFLGLTQPTLSRQIAALESALALMLFERNGRSLTLTEAGQELLSHVREMGSAANRLSLSASGQRSGLSGLVRITASDITSAYELPGIVQNIRLRAPQITVEIVASNTIEDLMQREADIAVRNVRPEQPNLVARLLREKSGQFFAAASYLEARGRPNSLGDLAQHDWIALGHVPRMHAYMADLGIPVEPENFRIVSENGVVAWEMCKAGLGISPMDSEVAAKTPQVERILPEHLQVNYPVWLVTHREIHTSPRIRLVFDLLAQGLS